MLGPDSSLTLRDDKMAAQIPDKTQSRAGSDGLGTLSAGGHT